MSWPGWAAAPEAWRRTRRRGGCGCGPERGAFASGACAVGAGQPAAVSLAAGSRQLAQRKVLVKRLVCIEDLGDIDVLFTDKTGTLTEGSLPVLRSTGPGGVAGDEPLLPGLLCNEAVVEDGRAVGGNPPGRRVAGVPGRRGAAAGAGPLPVLPPLPGPGRARAPASDPGTPRAPPRRPLHHPHSPAPLVGPVEDSRVVTSISGNTVTLIGHVRTEAQRDAVIRAAWRGHAVMAVVDQIEITG